MNRIDKLLSAALLVFLLAACSSVPGSFSESGQLPVIFPDYTGIVIPPNIAPLNFQIKEKGERFLAKISVPGEEPVVIENSDGIVDVGLADWRNLLQKASGKTMSIDVFVRSSDGRWQKFKTIENTVANEEIDSHLVYRLINTGYVIWREMGIYQRNLENFEETVLIDNKAVGNTCVNCHSFAGNNPENMLVHVRAINAGTLLYTDGKLRKLNTRTKYTLAPGGYPNWSNDGKKIAFSVNVITQRFYSKDIRIEVTDEASDLAVYDVEKNEMVTAPQVSTENRENLPVWSPDGKHIYYISAPPVIDYDSKVYSRYSLVRVPFDQVRNKFGQPDTVLSASAVGQSITFPKVSPDGRYLMFTMSDHGYFTINYPKADIYVLDLQSGNYQKIDANSSQVDSYHCWASSGRWFVFSSKRMDGLYTRPYFCYFDQDGKVSKPFVLPQKDPRFYESFLKNYNIPELITGPAKPTAFELREAILNDAKPVKLGPGVDSVYMSEHLRK